MTVTVNGDPVTIAGPSTIADLLAERGQDRPGIAVAVNGEVVPAPRHGATTLTDGDTVEIVTAVQGG